MFLPRGNLKFKLFISLFALVTLGFTLLIFIQGFTIESRTGDAVQRLSRQLASLTPGDTSALFKSGISDIQHTLDRLPQALVKETRNRLIITSIFCIIGILAAAGLIFHFVFLKPIQVLSQGLEKAVRQDEKDLTVRLPLNRNDEIGQLSSKFNIFVSTLDQIIQDIGAKTETITAAASEVSGVSDLMSEESEDLSTRSNSVAAAAEEMNVSMKTMTSASGQAASNIAMVAEAALRMQDQMSEVAKNCDNAGQRSNFAKGEAEKAADKVNRLGEAAREISKVTSMITEIAEQTNLLALNSAIEAARAGDAGKGFAVVAAEIKNLAAQTAQATGHIDERIQEIQDSARETVDEVGHIAQVIADVDDIVQVISQSMDTQSGNASEVAGNIEQASLGISQVNDNLGQGSEVAAEIAADVAQVDAVAAGMSDRSKNLRNGAGDLDSLSLSLQKMISVFKVSQNRQTDIKADTLTSVADLMPWGPQFATGIEQIDTQHKELVRLVNQLHRAMRQQKGAREVGGILGELANYTVFHFGFEEKLFDRYNYPDTKKHKEIHTDLVNEVSAFQTDFNAGKASVTMELMDFLKNWLKGHIMGTDKAYAPFLKAHMAQDPEFKGQAAKDSSLKSVA